MIPAPWRLPPYPTHYYIVLWPLQEKSYLLVLPPERAHALHKNLAAKSLLDRSSMALAGIIGSQTSPITALDAAGRLALPAALAEKAGITNKAVLIGSINVFQIWDPDRWKTAFSVQEALAFENLKTNEYPLI
jgi:DNA-binding transcriptional regulator/RsmH inhibitor MraZ